MRGKAADSLVEKSHQPSCDQSRYYTYDDGAKPVHYNPSQLCL